ncbi:MULTISPECIES: cutinase family protein [unclassified Mycolicibacterium]|uniref:cutinase family protein n=1 Tax=unclassified Mycolicibacterium TaxID=2636767 RepID=UPI001308C18E|nr:cutinase family protein [Mycolicibacterium sp. CBMA 329]MUL87133.1 cutinase family protein [Mycolicibacterium sp. CBMA 331]MUL98585.1 cutinase family protein [Mycolicibacterium sp. CBMA 334]MUM28320.1 cutinase family protein [Mycolicibacterium sp. CBMA 295]MUM37430.1 cutinase family protein [Mycolicibacterium sp. CBMA 247]MUM43198.1 cutinase family protein [Mycolicibacterium sp. CBMA 294]
MVKLPAGRLLRRWISVGAIIAAALVVLPVTSTALPGSLAVADAAPCPPVEVVFARGRTEPAGVGTLGNAFVNALRSRVNKNIGVYAVRYPADTEVDIGANDMSGHIQYMMNNCPDTRLVIGGYSLGAAVADVVLAVPFTAMGFKTPLPAGADGHIAAVALFGNGAGWVGPITNFNPVYRDRTIELCHGADPICNPADPDTWKNNWPDHMAGAYIDGGMVNQAADFVAGRL